MVEGGHLGFPRFSHVKPINVNKSASKSLRRSILVSKFTFPGSMNAVKMLGISVSDVLPTVDQDGGRRPSWIDKTSAINANKSIFQATVKVNLGVKIYIFFVNECNKGIENIIR